MTVLNAASIGTYPQVIAEREDRMDDFGKWLGGVVATWRALREATPVTIERNGRRARVWSVFVSVGRNTPDQVATMQRQTIDDAVLDIRLHHARGSRLRAVASLAFGRKSTAFLRAVRSDAEELRSRAHPRSRPRAARSGPSRARPRCTCTTASSSRRAPAAGRCAARSSRPGSRSTLRHPSPAADAAGAPVQAAEQRYVRDTSHDGCRSIRSPVP